MATKRKPRDGSWTWASAVVSTEGAPMLIADVTVYARRTGDEGDGPADYVDVCESGDGKVVLLDTDGGGPADVGWNDEDMVVVLASSDLLDEPKKLARLKKAIEATKYPEYLVGDIEVADGVCVADGASSGAGLPGTLPTAAGSIGDRWYLPRAAGRYTVVEGHVDGDGEARWCRITPHGRHTYERRAAAPKVDPVQAVLDRISFANPVAEARALEAALELIELGRADLALEVCAKASAERRPLAAWTRIMALAARRDPAAQGEAVALAESWLAPAASTHATNQVLPRKQVLRAIDAASSIGAHTTLEAVRARIVAAPEPDIFVAEGDDFF